MLKKLFVKKNLKVVIVFFLVLVFLLMLVFSYGAFFAHKVFPGVRINGQSFVNQSYSDVYNFLQSKTENLMRNGINYKYLNHEVNIRPVVDTLDDPDLSKKIISFENKETAQLAFSFGHYKSIQENLWEQIKILFKPKNIVWRYDLDEYELKNILKENFSEYEVPFYPPNIKFVNGEIVINKSVSGKEFNYEEITQRTKQNIDNFILADIEVELIEIKSPITLEMAEQKKDLIQKVANLDAIILNYDQRYWRISSEIFKNWLILETNSQGEIVVSFDFDKYEEHLQKFVVPDINQESQNAKFEIADGRVIKFQGSHDGQKVNLKQTLGEIIFTLNDTEEDKNISGELNIDLAVDTIKAEVETQNVNDLGIKEIIGVGESNFRGSPRNRVHNIKVGAEKLNGILIPPGGEFATMTNLTPVDAASGYLPELVIKGNKTIPEYGGGLCQIGTTVYRAALQSGLKITQRRPHSYRVFYYEPAGTDATVYDPWPDMKFVNDTDNYILIQTEIVGTQLYFNFWGTKDGRKVTVTDPVIYNITSPGPTKEIETTELEPGEKDCTESAHNGADAYFDYTVDYADDRETYEERVHSHYVPWQAVCLIGVEKITTSTEEVIEE